LSRAHPRAGLSTRALRGLGSPRKTTRAKQFAFIKAKCYEICNGPDRLPPQTQDPIVARAPSVVDGAFSFVAPTRACNQGSGRSLARRQGERRQLTPQEHQSLGLVQVVAYVATGTCLAQVAGRFDSLAPATALPAPTKMPCRWHCERLRQDDGIHRHAAGNVLHSLVSSLPTGPPFLRSGTQQL
jgi:hypothetical protein